MSSFLGDLSYASASSFYTKSNVSVYVHDFAGHLRERAGVCDSIQLGVLQ